MTSGWLLTTRVSRRRQIIPSRWSGRGPIDVVDKGKGKGRQEVERSRGHWNEKRGQRHLETSGQIVTRDRSKMNPSLTIVDAVQLVGVENREHFEMPLSEMVDPFREVVLSVGSANHGLKAFLSRQENN